MMKLASLKKVMAALPDETKLVVEVPTAVDDMAQNKVFMPNTLYHTFKLEVGSILIYLDPDEEDLHVVELRTEPAWITGKMLRDEGKRILEGTNG
jgi:hypothetical protein